MTQNVTFLWYVTAAVTALSCEEALGSLDLHGWTPAEETNFHFGVTTYQANVYYCTPYALRQWQCWCPPPAAMQTPSQHVGRLLYSIYYMLLQDIQYANNDSHYCTSLLWIGPPSPLSRRAVSVLSFCDYLHQLTGRGSGYISHTNITQKRLVTTLLHYSTVICVHRTVHLLLTVLSTDYSCVRP